MGHKKQPRFTQVPNDLLRAKLTPEEKLTWIVLKSFDWNGGGCRPSVGAISEMVGCCYRHTLRLIQGLIDKGYCERTTTLGKPSSYTVKIPDTHDTSVTPTCDTQTSGPHVTRDTHVIGGVTSRAQTCDTHVTQIILKKNTKEKYNVRTPEKSGKPKATHDPEVIEREILAIDLEAVHKKFPTKDVDGCFEEFHDTCLNGTAKKPVPNPYDYIDFTRGLYTWLRKRPDMEKPARDPNRPLSPEQYWTPPESASVEQPNS